MQIAELATLNEVEMYEYEQSLKEYQGMKNVIDTAFKDGFQDGFQDGIKDRTVSMVQEMIKDGLDFERISRISKLPVAEIEKIAAEMNDN